MFDNAFPSYLVACVSNTLPTKSVHCTMYICTYLPYNVGHPNYYKCFIFLETTQQMGTKQLKVTLDESTNFVIIIIILIINNYVD